MDDFQKLANEFGLQTEDLGLSTEPLKNLGGGYYEHLLGDYIGLVGRLKIQFVDREGKKAEKGTAGAVAGYGGLQLLIMKNPEVTLIDNTFKLPTDTEYSKFIFNQYVTLEADRQWQNVQRLSDFVFNDHPELAVISGKRNEEEINLTNLQFYYGYPVKFTLEEGKKKGGRYISKGSLELLDHEITKEKIATRKTVTNSLYSQLDALLEIAKAKRDTEKAEGGGTDATPSSAESPDSFLPDFNM